MLSTIAAAALAAATPAPTPAPPTLSSPEIVAADPDVRCYLAMTLALAGLGISNEANAAEVVGVTAIIWYYYGRMETKFPDVDFAPGLALLSERPNYAQGLLQEDAVRCGAEAERKGKEMQGLGERMQQQARLTDHNTG